MIKAYFHLLRIPSWSKNVFVLAPAFFAGVIFDAATLLNVLLAAAAFCLTASAVYVFNDIVDYESDKKHPSKRTRPIASGLIPKQKALVLLGGLTIANASLFVFLNIYVVAILLLYVFLNILYSFWLKHVAALDVLLVASFYVLRVLAGGFAANVPVSSWLIVTTFFLALLLVLGKRRSEFAYSANAQRPVLTQYSGTFLNAAVALAAGLALISYSSYILIVHPEPLAVYTIFFILLGIMRYLQLVYDGKNLEAPEKVIWKDKFIMASMALWLFMMYFVFYSPRAV